VPVSPEIVPHRWRVPPPAFAEQVRWPEAFGRRFTIFVDTEEEFDWSAPISRAERSVETIAALPALHARFAQRGVAPTYLIDHPVASDAHAVDLLRAMIAGGQGAIGTQLHPWVNPPHVEEPSQIASFVGNLPRDLQAAKLDCLTDTIAQAFGERPIAFRAGRYGIGPETFALLAERGYRLDTSIRAHHDYRAAGGPDFGAIGSAAFRVDGLVELPLSTIFTGRLRAHGASLHPALGRVPKGRGLFARTGLLSRVPLTPEGVPIVEAIAAVRIALAEGVRLLNFAFHSPSLVPGHTPYVRDAADLARFHRWWDAMFDLLAAEQVLPASLAQIMAACQPDHASATTQRVGL